MLQNAYFLAKIGADTGENERNFAEVLPKIGNYLPYGSTTLWSHKHRPPGAGRSSPARRSLKSQSGARVRVFRSLVFGCIGADLCKKIRVLQHFSKSTRLSI